MNRRRQPFQGRLPISQRREDGLPLGGALHHIRFSRASGAFTAQECDRARLLGKRLGLTLELAG